MKKLIFTFGIILTSFFSMSQTSPVLVFGNLTYDFGKINYTGDTLVANFWFKNQGVGELQILSAKPSCGCTVADFPKTVPVGTGSSITVKYYNANPGFINKSVTVTTNDPNNPVVVLRIKGETYKPE
jgi:hypothetical protein